MSLCFISHMNRVSMSVAGNQRIMEQFGFSPTQMGTVYSAFLFVYTVFMTPGGVFIDRVGPRRALATMGFGSACFGVLTGAVGLGFVLGAHALATFLVIRGLMGFLTTPLHPGCARAVNYWVPLPERSCANGLVNGAALLGIACTYPVFGALIDAVDWPRAFFVTATCTAVLTIIWLWYSTDRPQQHAATNEAERKLHLEIGENVEAFASASVSREDSTLRKDRMFAPLNSVSRERPLAAVPEYQGRQHADPPSERGSWTVLLRSRSLLLLTLSYAAVGYFQYLFFYWMQYYFEQVLHLGKTASQFYASLPPLAMAVGMPVGGLVSDRLQRVYGRRLGRAVVPIAGVLASAVFLLLGIFAKQPMWIVFWFSLALGVMGCSEGPFWSTAVEIGRKRGGMAAAIMNTGGNGGGMLAPVITPWASEHYGWPTGIGLGAAVCLVAALCWLWINPDERPDGEASGLVQQGGDQAKLG